MRNKSNVRFYCYFKVSLSPLLQISQHQLWNWLLLISFFSLSLDIVIGTCCLMFLILIDIRFGFVGIVFLLFFLWVFRIKLFFPFLSVFSFIFRTIIHIWVSNWTFLLHYFFWIFINNLNRLSFFIRRLLIWIWLFYSFRFYIILFFDGWSPSSRNIYSWIFIFELILIFQTVFVFLRFVSLGAHVIGFLIIFLIPTIWHILIDTPSLLAFSFNLIIFRLKSTS